MTAVLKMSSNLSLNDRILSYSLPTIRVLYLAVTTEDQDILCRLGAMKMELIVIGFKVNYLCAYIYF